MTGTTSAPSAHKGRRGSVRRRPLRLPYLLIAPAVLLEAVVHVAPILLGIAASVLSLNQTTMARWWAAPFAGLRNFAATVDPTTILGQGFWRSIAVTAAFTVVVVTASWAIGTAAAIALQSVRRGRGLLRGLFLIPYALPAFTAVLVWNYMLQRDAGVVNAILVDELGLLDERPFWLLGSNAFGWMCAVAVWKLWPFVFLVVTSALQSVPKELYEAAALDGAGPWFVHQRITLPLIGDVNRLLILVLVLWTFNDFTTPYLLFGEEAPPQVTLISLHIFRTSFGSWNVGAGAAMSVALIVLLAVFAALFLRLTRRSAS